MRSAELLTGYHDAVHDMTIRYVEGLTDADFERIVDRLGPTGDPWPSDSSV